MNFRRLAAAAFAGITIATAAVWALAEPPKAGYAPDPAPHTSEKQWVFEVAYDKGASSIASVRSITVSKPTATPRLMGRFAIELWVGHQLLDRRRFDVPLLGDDERERDPKRPFKRPAFGRVTTKVKVQMADHSRTTVLAFVDRTTGDTRRYFWPPNEKGQLTPFSVKGEPVSDAGADVSLDAATSTASDAGADAASTTLDAGADAAITGDAGALDASMVTATDASAPDAARDASK